MCTYVCEGEIRIEGRKQTDSTVGNSSGVVCLEILRVQLQDVRAIVHDLSPSLELAEYAGSSSPCIQMRPIQRDGMCQIRQGELEPTEFAICDSPGCEYPRIGLSMYHSLCAFVHGFLPFAHHGVDEGEICMTGGISRCEFDGPFAVPHRSI